MLTDFFRPFTGGVEIHVESLATELVQRGHEVDVLTSQVGDAPAFAMINGVSVHRVHPLAARLPGTHQDRLRPWLPPMPDPAVTLAIRALLRDRQPEVIHGHDWIGRSVLPIRRMTDAAFVKSLHYYGRSCAKKTLLFDGRQCSGPAPAKCFRCVGKHYGAVRGPLIVAANAACARLEDLVTDATIAVSEATAEKNGYARVDEGLFIVPNMVVPPPAVTTPDEALDSALPDAPFMLYVGDQRDAKGFRVLCTAYAQMTNPPPLVVIGAKTSETPSPLPAGIIALSELPNAAVRIAWERCLFGIVPSVWAEPFGIVILECMAAGRPVVASRTGGIPDIVTDGEDGVLVTPGDGEELASAMAALAADGPRRERMGQAALTSVQRYFPDRIVPKVEAVYKFALIRRHAGKS